MIVAFALLAGAAITGFTAPRFLHRMTTSRIPPTVVIAWWFLTGAGVILTALSGVVLLLLPGHGPARWLLDRIHGCWSAVTHGALPNADDVLGTLGAVALVGVVTRVGFAAIKRRSAAMRIHQRQLDLLRLAARREPGRVPLLWLDHDEPLAYSVAGSPSFVVATTGLSNHLTDDQVAAVLAHEHAHLHGRHQALTGLAEAAAWALPFMPLTRQAPAATRVLVEMAADAAAAAQHGPDTVRSALLRVGMHGSPVGALGIMDDDVALRLHRLERTGCPKPLLRGCGLLVTSVAATASPAALGLGLLAVTAPFSCPLPL